jgi:hypothetical protein
LRRKKGKTNWTSFWRVRTIRMSGAPCTMTTTTKTSCSVRRRCVFPASCTTRKLSRACHGGPRACGRKRKGVAPLFRLFLGQHPCKILVVTARPRASHQSAAICCPRGQRIGDHSNTTLGFGLCPSVITREACVDGASCVCHPKRRARSPVVSLSFSSLFFPTAGCGGSSHSHAPHIPGRPRYDGSLSGVDGRTALCERRRPTSVCRRRVLHSCFAPPPHVSACRFHRLGEQRRCHYTVGHTLQGPSSPHSCQQISRPTFATLRLA